MEDSSDKLGKAASDISKTIRSANVKVADMKQMVEAIFRSAATGGAELAYIRFKDAEANHEVIMALQNRGQEVTNNDVAIPRESLSAAPTIAARMFRGGS